MSLETYCWVFMILYEIVMLWFGFLGHKKVKSVDDFATARASYGPWFLGLAFTSTIASGATFLGIPAWTARQSPNAFSAGTIGGLVCLATCIIVSKLTTKLPQKHLNIFFAKT